MYRAIDEKNLQELAPAHVSYQWVGLTGASLSDTSGSDDD